MPPGRALRFARGGALVFEFVGTIAGGAMFGWLLDDQLGTAPYGMVGCLVLSVCGGFVRLIQSVRRFDRMDRGPER